MRKKNFKALLLCFVLLLSFGLNLGCGGNETVHVHSVTDVIGGVEATCTENGVKEHAYCTVCGALVIKDGDKYVEATEDTLVIEKIPHKFDRKIETDEYLISEATANSPETFAKACVCGLKSEEEKDEFTVGKTLTEYAAEDKEGYQPCSVTISLYDAQNCVYGFCWNVKSKPARPVVEIREAGSEKYTRVRARHEKLDTYEYDGTDDKQIYLNYVKAEITLKPNTTYEYRAGDAYIEAFCETVTIKTVSPSESGKWSFVHVSDSQAKGGGTDGENSGIAFADTLDGISKNELNRFIVHTGDVVEWSRYEKFWTNMLDYNFSRLSTVPVMAISGNHETDYQQGSAFRSGSNETYKHFDYSIPKQSVKNGFYYSFSYGGVKFIMLNTNEVSESGALKTDQYEWLVNELKTKTEKWTIVAMHNPMYSVGKWGSDETKNNVAVKLTEQLGGIFAEYGVDLVLQGHDHMISRTRPIGKDGRGSEEKTETLGGVEYSINPKGTIYVMNGPAGDQAKGNDAIFPHDEALYAYAEKSNQSSWAEIEINGNVLTVNVKYMKGKTPVTLKCWGIKK